MNIDSTNICPFCEEYYVDLKLCDICYENYIERDMCYIYSKGCCIKCYKENEEIHTYYCTSCQKYLCKECNIYFRCPNIVKLE